MQRFPLLFLVSCLLIGTQSGQLPADAAVDLNADARLRVPLTLHRPQAVLSELLQEISQVTGARLVAGSHIADDHAVVLVRNKPAAACLASLASVMNYTVTVIPDGYRFDLNPGVTSWLVRQEQLDQLDDGAAERDQDAVAKALEVALGDAPDSETSPETQIARHYAPGLLGYLRTLPASARKILASAAAELSGVIYAGNAGQMRESFLFQRPLSTLPPNQQAAFRRAFDGPEGNSDEFRAQSDPMVGIVARGGGISLAFVAGDQIYSGEGAVFGGPEARAVEARYAEDTERLRAWQAQGDVPSPPWRDPVDQDLPSVDTRTWQAKSWTLQVHPLQDTNRADQTLDEFSRQASISIIADRFNASTYVPAAQLLAGIQEEATSALWARRVARAFRRLYRCQNGMLLLRSRSSRMDRHLEPPHQVVQALLRQKEEAGRLELGDYVSAVQGMSRRQTRALMGIRSEKGTTLWREAVQMESSRRLLLLLGGIPVLAEGGVGAGDESLEKLPATLKPTFLRLFWTGVLQPTATPLPAGLSWRTEKDSAIIELRDGVTAARSMLKLELGLRKMHLPQLQPGGDAAGGN